jgi:hydrogenase nickel incorporation protein HypB
MAEIQVMKNILGENDRIAAENQAMFREKGVYVINLMGSPGAGKTSVLEKTMEKLKGELRMAVIEGDLFTSKDADRIEKHGVPVIQINTAGGCHLDAPMVQKVAQQMNLDELDLLIVENVGNLVCPASFDLGEKYKVAILSVTEGEEKPLKYPDMFAAAQLMVINKIDLLPYVSFDVARCIENAKRVNPYIQVIQVSATTGEGMDAWLNWLATA